MNHKQKKRHNKHFMSAIYHACIFNMACAGACECNSKPFPSRLERRYLIYPSF